MAHQNTSSPTATAQNAATDPVETTDQQQGRDRPTEPRSYVAEDAADSSLAPPAAGEVADAMDEGEALAAEDVQQGGDHMNRPYRTEVRSAQGPKTTEANRDRLKGE